MLIDVHNILATILYQPRPLQYTTVQQGISTTDITVKDVFWVRAGKEIDIDGIKYLVKEINGSVITVFGLVTPTLIKANQPVYLNGTIPQANSERVNIQDKSSNTPLVFNYEVFDEDYGDKNSNEVEMGLVLFFLDESKFSATTGEYYSDVIGPMRVLAENFLNNLQKAKGVNEVASIEIRNHTRFANYSDKNGYENIFLSENLSGVEVRFDLFLSKTIKCKC
jgi:hypothetical protein